MNLNHDFVQVWKFSEDQKKNANRTLFLPEFRGRPKKKRSSARIEHFFPNLRSDVHTFKLLGGCRCGPFSNYWGGYSQIIGRIYPPILPGFRHPWFCRNVLTIPSTFNHLALLLQFFADFFSILRSFFKLDKMV